MKQPKFLFCLLLICGLFTSARAQYISELHDTWHDDALVDLQYNTTHLRPEGLFKLGTGFNVLGFNETTGAVLTSKFVIISGKTVTPKCMAKAGAKCFVLSEDATHFFYTCLNTTTGSIDYSIALLRTDTNDYTQLSPVDAAFDGGSTLHIVLSAKNYQNTAVWNLVYLSIDVPTGAILNARIFGDPTWDIYPNDVEYVDATHIYAAGWRKSHAPIGYLYKHMILELVGPYAANVCDIVITGTRPKSAHVKSFGTTGNLCLIADGYLPSLTAAGPLAVLGLTDVAGTINLNGAFPQRLYGSPGATFWIHDVDKIDQPGNRKIIVGGSLPVFLSVPSSPRNFIYDLVTNTATMNDYGSFLGGNANIRTVYSTFAKQIFSAAKEDNTSLVLHDLRTKLQPSTTDCRLPLSLTLLNNTINTYNNVVLSQALTYFTPQTFQWVDSYKTYDTLLTCWESRPKTAEVENPLSAVAPELTVSPNPTQGLVHLGNTESISQVRLYDPSGRLLFLRELPKGTASLEIDLTTMPAGLYLLETECGGGVPTRMKIVRQ